MNRAFLPFTLSSLFQPKLPHVTVCIVFHQYLFININNRGVTVVEDILPPKQPHVASVSFFLYYLY